MTAPLYQARSEEVGEALIEHIITKYGTPEYIMMYQDSAFMSSLMNYLFKALGIKIKTVGPYNHKSLQTETWNKVSVEYFDKTSNWTRTDMVQVSFISNICL